MLDIRFATARNASGAVAVVVPAGRDTTDTTDTSDDHSPAELAAARFATVRLSLTRLKLGPADLDDVTAFLADVEHSGSAGTIHKLPRPGRRPDRLLFVGAGTGDEAGWRAAGAKLAKSASSEPTLMILLPDDVTPAAVRGLGEGLWLASYRFRLGADEPPALRRIVLVPPAGAVPSADTAPAVSSADLAAGLALAKVVAESTVLARDLTNMPSDEKTPAWFAKRVEKAAAGVAGVTTTVRDPKALAEQGFNAILAVGGGSTRGPRLVEMSWRPRGARRHIVLVGKGITFDTGGICVKPLSGMKLMRKDMAGAAAVIGATLAAATLRLPVRITALAPLAENALGADSFRPGDVLRHYGGTTSEIHNTDAEGRLVLGDAMAYAVRRLRPDAIVDLATLTGAQGVALGKRTAALYSHSDVLAKELAEAAEAAGESMWRMPLHDDYVEALDSDVADIVNSTDVGAGSVMAALYLREFTGGLREQWAHLDMSSSAWADSADGELTKGATGWGVRTLLRWLEATA